MGAVLAVDAWDQLTGIFLVGMDWRLSFASYPEVHSDAGIVGLKQAWTLGAELMFYLLAPLLMRSWKIAVSLLVASFGLRAYFVVVHGTDIQDIWTVSLHRNDFRLLHAGPPGLSVRPAAALSPDWAGPSWAARSG